MPENASARRLGRSWASGGTANPRNGPLRGFWVHAVPENGPKVGRRPRGLKAAMPVRVLRQFASPGELVAGCL